MPEERPIHQVFDEGSGGLAFWKSDLFTLDAISQNSSLNCLLLIPRRENYMEKVRFRYD